jgi:hypothetical protein
MVFSVSPTKGGAMPEPAPSSMTIDRALADRRLLGAGLGDLGSWATWLVVLKSSFGLPLDDAERSTFRRIAGDRAPPAKRVRELWAVVARRSGKSRMAAALAVFLALFQKHKLAKGEVGHVLTLAATAAQAQTVHSYVLGFIEASEALQREVRAVTQHEIKLSNNVVIAVHANSFRSIRGRSLLGVIFDEVSFWRDEASATPDVEVYRAVMPSLIASNGMLVAISTPYRRMGLLHAKHRDHYGIEGDDVFVVQGTAEAFNPTLSSKLIEAHKLADPEAAVSEWDAQFRSDISAFLSEDLIELAIDRSRPPEIPPQRGGLQYKCFIDASGGRHDAYTACIGHKDNAGRFICDVLRGSEPPFDPQVTTREFAALAREYGCTTVTGDAYSADWVVSAFRECGLTYERSEKNKSDLYLEGLPAFSRGLVCLPEHRRLGRELRLLERHVSRAGRDRVDHGRNGSDDHANAVFGALHLAMGVGKYNYPVDLSWVSGPSSTAAEAEAEAAKQFLEQRMAAHIARYASSAGRLL